MAEQEPTLWELMRAVERIESKLNGVLTKPEFEAHQQALAQRFTEIDRRHTEWTVESRGAHVALDAEIEAVKVTVANNASTARDRQDKFEERLRTDRQKWQLTGAAAIASLIGSIVMFILNGGPS